MKLNYTILKRPTGPVTPNRPGRLSFLAVILLVAGLLAACGGGPSASADATAGQGSDNGQDGARGDAEFGLTEAEITRRVDAVEASIATCMSDAGFEYVPVDYATARFAMDSNSRSSNLNADEFRAQFGYGITTLFAGPDSQATLATGEQNLQIRQSLPAADRAAYLRALYGENPLATFVVSLDDENFAETGGCTRAAIEQAFSPEELGPGFVNYQNAEGVRIDQDPRVIAAYRDWAGCMRTAGYSYSDPIEIDADLASRLETVTGGQALENLATDTQADLDALQGEELAIAAADHACEVQFVDAIRLEVETELLGPAANQN